MQREPAHELVRRDGHRQGEHDVVILDRQQSAWRASSQRCAAVFWHLGHWRFRQVLESSPERALWRLSRYGEFGIEGAPSRGARIHSAPHLMHPEQRNESVRRPELALADMWRHHGLDALEGSFAYPGRNDLAEADHARAPQTR